MRVLSRAFVASVLALALGIGSSSCCLLVRPPDARELLATGFRTPEQTFRTFQIGWRAEEPDLERRCFSRGFRERNRVSRVNYREFRAQLVAEQPFLRLGISDAHLDGPARIEGDRALLRATTHGRTLELALVLDDSIEVWSGDELLLEEPLPFREHTQIAPAQNGAEILWGNIELPADLPKSEGARTITELRFSREWKIDDLQLIEGP